jgi:hypothetical protein
MARNGVTNCTAAFSIFILINLQKKKTVIFLHRVVVGSYFKKNIINPYLLHKFLSLMDRYL